MWYVKIELKTQQQTKQALFLQTIPLKTSNFIVQYNEKFIKEKLITGFTQSWP